MYYIDSSPREPRFVLVPLRFASEAWPRAGLGEPRSALNANKPASSGALKQGRKKCSKHGCDRETSTVDADKRIWSETPFWKELRKETLEMVLQHVGDERTLNRACFEMAVRREEGCAIVCDENLKAKIRALWIRLLRKHGSEQEGLEIKAEGQPFYLRLMKELLAFAGDVDREFLLEGEVGFPVGVLTPLPRTPDVYEEQTSWRLEEEPLAFKLSIGGSAH